MSLTSYRAAPSRVTDETSRGSNDVIVCGKPNRPNSLGRREKPLVAERLRGAAYSTKNPAVKPDLQGAGNLMPRMGVWSPVPLRAIPEYWEVQRRFNPAKG